jgi:hypothetical protein
MTRSQIAFAFEPMANPLEAPGFIDSVLVLQHRADARHDQRMHISASHLG